MRSRARGAADVAAAVLAAGALIASASGCQKRQPALEYMPNMAYGPRVAAQAEDPLRPGYSVERPPVEGTVPRDLTPYRFAQADTTQAMAALVNPLPRTAEVIGRGQRVYMNTCVVCHGPRGDGQGYIEPLYPQPPLLFSDKVRNWPDARIFHIITRGQNLMPSYASQILPEDRWAVVHYVRALQRAARPLPQDLPAKARAAGADSTAAAADTTGRSASR
ncbi:MAG TPA: cytochrome c [Candidatus Eisenbacteria bacterium]|nr:cytochrome c [Candidatus Eisenbacteria bacterium]